MRKLIYAFLLLILFPGSGRSTAIVVHDYLDREVKLEQPAERIIGLAPHIVENIFSAGAGDKIVAVVSYSNYPPAALQLPRIGSYHTVNYEAIVAANPDLVIMWQSGNGMKVLQTLQKLDLNVYVNEPRQLEDIARSINDIGMLAGTTHISNKHATAHLQKLTRLKKQYSDATPVSVLYQVWNDPLQTINHEHLISDVIRLCGGRNAFADAIALAPKINIESVLKRDPDVIIASGMNEQRPDWLDDWKKWNTLSAVKRNHLYFVPPDLIQRHTLRILEGAQIMCEQINSVREARKKQTHRILESFAHRGITARDMRPID